MIQKESYFGFADGEGHNWKKNNFEKNEISDDVSWSGFSNIMIDFPLSHGKV
jgi:hypothetical protein